MSSGRAAALAAVLLALAGCGGGTHHAAAVHRPNRAQLHGLAPQPVPHTPRFTLTDTSGRRFAFAARTRGKLAYLYFGYTHCPDVCPTTMSDVAAALRREPASVRRHVEVVFVTVDPRRDTSPVLRAWLDHFDRSFVGLRGTLAEIVAAEHAAGVPVAPPGKTIAHSSFLLPYSPDGRAHVVYTEGFRTADYAHDMPLLLTY